MDAVLAAVRDEAAHGRMLQHRRLRHERLQAPLRGDRLQIRWQWLALRLGQGPQDAPGACREGSGQALQQRRARAHERAEGDVDNGLLLRAVVHPRLQILQIRSWSCKHGDEWSHKDLLRLWPLGHQCPAARQNPEPCVFCLRQRRPRLRLEPLVHRFCDFRQALEFVALLPDQFHPHGQPAPRFGSARALDRNKLRRRMPVTQSGNAPPSLVKAVGDDERRRHFLHHARRADLHIHEGAGDIVLLEAAYHARQGAEPIRRRGTQVAKHLLQFRRPLIHTVHAEVLMYDGTLRRHLQESATQPNMHLEALQLHEVRGQPQQRRHVPAHGGRQE
mmetsp:Transcript_85546/g.276030  ORF Transcript_85546/g.276030 Transcript_85546/m.276030 type:complete len:333 (-) Transcript_85546:134-1132(-)